MTTAAAPWGLWQVEPQWRPLPEADHEPEMCRLYRHEPRTLRLGMIRSADGKAAGEDGSSRSLNGPVDLRVLRVLRAAADVVLVGAHTARVERYADISLPEPLVAKRSTLHSDRLPPLAIVTLSGVLPPGVSPDKNFVVTSNYAPAVGKLADTWGDRLLRCGADDISPRTVLNALAERGYSRILCEGGPRLAARFLERDLVDEWCYTVSPHAGGADAAPVPAVPDGATLAHRLEGEGFAMERWLRPARR